MDEPAADAEYEDYREPPAPASAKPDEVFDPYAPPPPVAPAPTGSAPAAEEPAAPPEPAPPAQDEPDDAFATFVAPAIRKKKSDEFFDPFADPNNPPQA